MSLHREGAWSNMPPNKRMQQTGGAMVGRGAPPAADARCSTGAIMTGPIAHMNPADPDTPARHTSYNCRSAARTFHWASVCQTGAATECHESRSAGLQVQALRDRGRHLGRSPLSASSQDSGENGRQLPMSTDVTGANRRSSGQQTAVPGLSSEPTDGAPSNKPMHLTAPFGGRAWCTEQWARPPHARHSAGAGAAGDRRCSADSRNSGGKVQRLWMAILAASLAGCGTTQPSPVAAAREIALRETIPGGGSSLRTEACGGLWVVPLQAGFVARYDETLSDSWVFAELFNDAGSRCAYGFSDQANPMNANTPTALAVPYFLVSPEDVPSRCQYPTHIASLHATLFSGAGSVQRLPPLVVREFGMNLDLSGDTTTNPDAGPCDR